MHSGELFRRAFCSGKSFLFFSHFYDCLLDFIYPPTCLLCERRSEGSNPICSECWNEFTGLLDSTVQKGRAAFHHLSGEIHFDEVVTCWDYTPEMETLIHRIKYQMGRKLGVLLGRVVGEALRTYFQSWDDGVMLPVPLHRIRQRERGYNQSALLCQGMEECIQIPINSRLLVRNRHTSTQTKLTALERQKNVREAFEVRCSERLEGRRIILVDDVSTTGATMNGCASVLRKAGADEIVGVALARPKLK